LTTIVESSSSLSTVLQSEDSTTNTLDWTISTNNDDYSSPNSKTSTQVSNKETSFFSSPASTSFLATEPSSDSTRLLTLITQRPDEQSSSTFSPSLTTKANENSLSSGAIIGIVIGSLAGVSLLGFIGYYLYFKTSLLTSRAVTSNVVIPLNDL
jgi:hypothetical protein